MSDDAKSGVSVNRLTSTYIKIRDRRSALKAEFDAQDRELREQQDRIKRALLDYCKDQELESVRTDSGLVMRKVKTKYWTNDWESMYKFVVENAVPEFFSKSLNQSNVKQFLEENPDLMPKGLNIDREYEISVRKK